MLNELVKMVVLHVRVPGFESHLWFLAPASSKCHEDGSDVWVPDLSDSAGEREPGVKLVQECGIKREDSKSSINEIRMFKEAPALPD